jgi:hypothetical protein
MPVMLFKNTFMRPSVDVPFYDEEQEIHGEFHKGVENQGFVDYTDITWSDDRLSRTFTRYTFVESVDVGIIFLLGFRMNPDWYEFAILKEEYNNLHNITHDSIKIEFYDDL